MQSMQLDAGVRGDADMHSPLHPAVKITLAVVLLLLVLHYWPAIAGASVLLALALVGLLGAMALGATVFLALTALIGLGVLAAVVAVAVGLAPLWLPVLAVIGLIALVRSSRRPKVA